MTKGSSVLQYRGVDARGVLESIEMPLPASTAAPALVLMVGLPGSGKSTLSRLIAPAIKAVILESDALRRRLFRPPTHLQDESRALFKGIYDAMTGLLKQGVSVILDATNLKESDRRPVEAIAHEMGARLVVVYVTAPATVVEERLRHRDAAAAAGAPSEAGIEVYRRMANTMQPPAPVECIRVDTSDQVFYEAAVQQIIRVAASQVPAGRSDERLPALNASRGRVPGSGKGSKGGSWGGRS